MKRIKVEGFAQTVSEVIKNGTEYKTTPRKLINAFGFERRTSNNQKVINGFLEENNLTVVPSYLLSWIDGSVALRQKEKATSNNLHDPIQRLEVLKAANTQPDTIPKNAMLKEAVTKMMLHDYSQLPVMSSPRKVEGVISWETIGKALANGDERKDVSAFMTNEFILLDHTTPLMKAISQIEKHGFALVKAQDQTLCGIVTTADISAQFLSVTEPFLFVEEIEKHLRHLLAGTIFLENLKNFVKEIDPNREVNSIDDLTFGEYLRLIENPTYWDRLELAIDRKIFVGQLDKIREIRNDIMHFDPDGITDEARRDLKKMAKFLQEIVGFQSDETNNN